RGPPARPPGPPLPAHPPPPPRHPLDDLVTHTVHENLTGIEYLGGIPGTTGAAPVQNAGAYGQEIGTALTAVTAYDWTTRTTTRIPRAACGFGYRTSVFKQQPGRWTILSLTLRLRRSRIAAPVTYQHLATALDVPLGARRPLAEAAAAVVRDRRARGLLLPDDGPDRRQAGSCYLNPRITPAQAEQLRCTGAPVHRTPDGEYRTSAGWLLEHVGFTPGSRVAPGIRCSSRRALTLTAHSGATATAFRQALSTMAAKVHIQTGITLTSEPVLVAHRRGDTDGLGAAGPTR
ncbi:hypothetical protein, partial [Streptomyces sp. NPDC058861]|uniref:hypothetical protein n=1 Tax=Streptomyces sp. NPDC058861 TaxID=3346653 RepID=UPI0036B1ED1A